MSFARYSGVADLSVPFNFLFLFGQSSLEIGERGEREFQEARKMKEDLSAQSECLQSQLAELREKEQRMAAVSLCMINSYYSASFQLVPT